MKWLLPLFLLLPACAQEHGEHTETDIIYPNECVEYFVEHADSPLTDEQREKINTLCDVN